MTAIWSTSSTEARHDAYADWRRRKLIVAGFDVELATRLAGDGRVDVHALLLLLDRGCPPGLAARILAPLDFPVSER